MSNLNGNSYFKTQLLSIKEDEHLTNLTNLSNYSLENFFENVTYNNSNSNSNEDAQFVISIKDRKLLDIDASKIHLVKCNENAKNCDTNSSATILLHLSFINKSHTPHTQNCQSHIFKLDNPSFIHLSNYTIDLNQENMKIILNFKENNAEHTFEIFRKNLIRKTFFNKTKKLLFSKILYNNAENVHRKKLKHKIFNVLINFFFYSIKKSFLEIKASRLRRNASWHLFLQNYNNSKEIKNRVLNNCTSLTIKFFHKFFFNKVKAFINEKNKFSTLKDKFNKNIKYFIQKKVFYKIKKFYNMKSLINNHNNMSKFLVIFFGKNKIFKIIKNNFENRKRVREKVDSMYFNKLKFKALIALQNILNLKIKRVRAISQYNDYNFYFLKIISDNFLNIKREESISREDTVSSLIQAAKCENDEGEGVITINTNTLFKNVKDFFHLKFYSYPIKNCFNIIKNNYLRKKMIYNKLLKIAYKKLTIYKNENKIEIIKLAKSIIKFKKFKQKFELNNFIKRIIAKYTSKKCCARLNNAERFFIVTKNFFNFLFKCFNNVKIKTSKKINTQIFTKKNVKLKFFQFINALHLKQINTGSPLVSPKNLNKHCLFKFITYKDDIVKKFTIRKIKSFCVREGDIQLKQSLIKRKLNFFNILDFFNIVKVLLKLKNFDKKKRENCRKSFFLIAEEKLQFKKYIKSACLFRKDKLVQSSFIGIKSYSSYRLMKKQKYSNINKDKDKDITDNSHLFIKTFFAFTFKNILLLNSKQNKFKEKQIENNKKIIFNKFKKVLFTKRVKLRVEEYIKKNCFKFFKEILNINTNFKNTTALFFKKLCFYKMKKELKYCRSIKSKHKKLFFFLIRKNVNNKIAFSKNLYKVKNIIKKNTVNSIIKKLILISKIRILTARIIKINKNVFCVLNFKFFFDKLKYINKFKIVTSRIKRNFLKKFIDGVRNRIEYNKETNVMIKKFLSKHLLKFLMESILNSLIRSNVDDRIRKFVLKRNFGVIKNIRRNIDKTRMIKSNSLDDKNEIYKSFWSKLKLILKKGRINNILLGYTKAKILSIFKILKNDTIKNKPVNGKEGIKRCNTKIFINKIKAILKNKINDKILLDYTKGKLASIFKIFRDKTTKNKSVNVDNKKKLYFSKILFYKISKILKYKRLNKISFSSDYNKAKILSIFKILKNNNTKNKYVNVDNKKKLYFTKLFLNKIKALTRQAKKLKNIQNLLDKLSKEFNIANFFKKIKNILKEISKNSLKKKEKVFLCLKSNCTFNKKLKRYLKEAESEKIIQ